MTDEEWNKMPCGECSGTNKRHDNTCPYWECLECGDTCCKGQCIEEYEIELEAMEEYA